MGRNPTELLRDALVHMKTSFDLGLQNDRNESARSHGRAQACVEMALEDLARDAADREEAA